MLTQAPWLENTASQHGKHAWDPSEGLVTSSADHLCEQRFDLGLKGPPLSAGLSSHPHSNRLLDWRDSIQKSKCSVGYFCGFLASGLRVSTSRCLLLPSSDTCCALPGAERGSCPGKLLLPGNVVFFIWEGVRQGQLWLLRWEKSVLLPHIKTFPQSAASPTWLGLW